MNMKSEFLKLAGLTEAAEAAAADVQKQTTFVKNSNEIASVKLAIRKAVKYCEHEASATKSPNSRKVYEADAEAYDYILGLINAGKQAMARKRWADMDTSARDVIFDLTTDKSTRKLIAEYFGTTVLREADESDDSETTSSTEGDSDDKDEIVDKDIADLKALVAKLEKAQEKDVDDEGTEDSADKKVTVSIAKIKADIETLIKNQQADDISEGIDSEDDIPRSIKNSHQGTKVKIHQPNNRFHGAVGRLTGTGTKGTSEVEFDDFPTSMHRHENIKLVESMTEGWQRPDPKSQERVKRDNAGRKIKTPDGVGTVIAEYKVPTFSQMVPFKHTVRVKLDSGITTEFNMDMCKLFKSTANVDEATNHMDEREYQTYASWRTACKKAYPGCGFRGDKDIGAATLGGKDVGEWDGAVGSVYNKENIKESAEAYKDMSDKQLAIWAKLENIEDDIQRDGDGVITNRAEIIKKLTDTLKESDTGTDFTKASDSELKKYANQAGIEDSIVLDGEGDIENRAEIIKLLKADQVNETADTSTKVVSMTDAVDVKDDKESTTKVPAAVMKAVTDKIKELEDEIKYTSHLQSQEQHLVNISGAIQVLTNIKELLAVGCEESMKKVSVLLTSLEGAQKVLVPKEVWKYMSFDYANPMANKPSLMDKFKEVKAYSSKV